MARIDAIVLGAGIVGTSIGLHLAKRGLAVALVDRRAPGRGNIVRQCGRDRRQYDFSACVSRGPGRSAAGSPQARAGSQLSPGFPAADRALALGVSCGLSPAAADGNGARHAAAVRARGRRARSAARRVGRQRYLRKEGWLKVYRRDRTFRALAGEFALAQEFGIPYRALDVDATRELEPNLAPVFRHAVHWQGVASVTNPLAVTKAYAARFAGLGGVMMTGNARSLRRAKGNGASRRRRGRSTPPPPWWRSGLLRPTSSHPLGIKLPLGIKRGYHRHYRGAGNAALARPVVDTEIGYCLAPMEQGIRLTTGAEFAARDAKPTPVQFERLLPAAKDLFPLGEPVEATPWMGSRPCFPDSRPVLGRAPGQAGSVHGHAHWGLTLGPTTGRLLAEMMTGGTPFCDPAPYRRGAVPDLVRAECYSEIVRTTLEVGRPSPPASPSSA